MNRSAITVAALGCALAGGLLLPVSAEAAPTPAAPQVQIAVDNGQQSAAIGETLRYVVSVTNLGSTPVRDMVVTQTVPAGTTVSTSGVRGPKATVVGGGTGQQRRLQWPVTLAAGQKVTLHSGLRVASAPDTLLRLATVACLQTGAKAAPVVCASDSDALPAGTDAQSRAEVVPPATPTTATSISPWWYAGGAAVLLLLTSAAVAWRRSLRPSVT